MNTIATDKVPDLTVLQESKARLHPFSSARLLLVWYLICLAFLAAGLAITEARIDITVLASQDTHWIAQWAGQLVAVAMRDFVLFFPLAFLVACTFPMADQGNGRVALLLTALASLVVSLALATAVRTTMNGFPICRPTLPAILYLGFCCCWGSWTGATWMRARSATAWFLGQAGLFATLLALIVGGLVWLSVDSQPLEIHAKPIHTEDRRRLVKMFRENDPRDIQPGSKAHVTLTQQDINQLLSWAVSLGPVTGKARVDIVPENVALALSIELPRSVELKGFLNAQVSAKAFTRKGQLGIQPHRMQIGRLAVPRWLLALSGPVIIDETWHNKHTQPFLSSFEGIQLKAEQVTVTYGHLDLPKGFLREALADLGGLGDMAPATSVYVEQLIQRAQTSDSTLTFSDCLQTVFDEARQRSANGDPIQENRAALLSLGILLGHSRIKTLVGPELPEPPPQVKRNIRHISLRGRRDWTRHFTVSAALEVLSNVASSNAVGLLKEELDADGGSGFSFRDLLADRAGTTLATVATSSPESARALQNRLAAGCPVDDYFPPAADLPEGLSDAELRLKYGGVGGEQYQRLVTEIERRISACTAYVIVN